MKKVSASLLLGAGMLGAVNAGAQPSVTVEFGQPPVTAINQRQVWQYVVNCALPPHFVVRTATETIPSSTWNATVGQKLKGLPVQIASLEPCPLANIPNAQQTNCIAAYFDLGGKNVDAIDLTHSGELETVWVNDAGFQSYVMQALNHGTTVFPPKTRFLAAWQKTSFGIEASQLAQIRLWNPQQ